MIFARNFPYKIPFSTVINAQVKIWTTGMNGHVERCICLKQTLPEVASLYY